MNMPWRWPSKCLNAARPVTKEGELFPPVRGVARGIEMIALREKGRAIPFIHTRHFYYRPTNAVSAVCFQSWIMCIEISWDCFGVLQEHFSPPPFPRRICQVTVHATLVTSTTQSSPFRLRMLRHAQELLVMLLHQCCPWRQSQKRNAAMDIDAWP